MMNLFLSILVGARILILQSGPLPIYDQVVRGLTENREHTYTLKILPLSSRDLQSLLQQADAVVPVGSKALRMVLEAKPQKIPVVYTAVFNSAQYNIQKKNYTGVSLEIPPFRQLKTLKSVFPALSKVGVPYGEMSRSQAERLFLQSQELGLQIFLYAVQNSRDIPTMMKAMKEARVQFVWLPVDTVFASVNAVKMLLTESRKKKLPLWGYSEGHVRAGATFGMEPDFEEVGRATADILDLVLDPENKEQPGAFLTVEASSFHAFLNTKSLYGLKPDPKVLKTLTRIYPLPEESSSR